MRFPALSQQESDCSELKDLHLQERMAQSGRAEEVNLRKGAESLKKTGVESWDSP